MNKVVLSLSKNKFEKIYPWLAIIVSALFLFYKYILQVSPSIMTNAIMRAFHVHGAGLGNLAAMFFYSYLITQLFVGVLLDKYSPRYLSTIAIVVAAIGTYFFSMAHSLLWAAIARMLMGIGAAFATVSYMKVAAMWFRPNQFAFVGGLLATAAMVGAIFGEAPLSMLVDIEGWRRSLFYCAILGFIIAALFVIVVRDRQPGDSPVDKISSKSNSAGITLKDVFLVLSSKQNWLLTFYSGLAFSPVAVFGGLWGNPFLEEAHNLSRTSAASLISFVFIGLAIGGPLLGLISDLLKNRKKIMFAGVGLSFISIVGVIYINILPLWVIIILLFLFGFGTGAFMLGFAIGREINKISLTATVIALINTGDALFGAYTEPLIGKLLDVGWSGRVVKGVHFFSARDYHHAFLVLPIYLLLAFILLFFIKETKKASQIYPQ